MAGDGLKKQSEGARDRTLWVSKAVWVLDENSR